MVEWARLLLSSMSSSRVFRYMKLILNYIYLLSMYLQGQLQRHLQTPSLLVSGIIMWPQGNALFLHDFSTGWSTTEIKWIVFFPASSFRYNQWITCPVLSFGKKSVPKRKCIFYNCWFGQTQRVVWKKNFLCLLITLNGESQMLCRFSDLSSDAL